MTTHEHRPSIALIGAGSQVFGFSMCTDICQTPELKGADIRLIDIAAIRRRPVKTMNSKFPI